MAYYLFTVSVDGMYFEQVDPSKLTKDLSDGDWGENPIFLDSLPEQYDPNKWPGAIDKALHILIKGDIVIPKAKEVVIKYEL